MILAISLAWITLVLAPAQAQTDYASEVIASGAAPYYRLDEDRGSVAMDASSDNEDAVYKNAGFILNQPGLLVADPNPAAVFFGSSGIERRPSENPTQYTMEGWFKPTNRFGAQTLIARVNANNQWVELVGLQNGGQVQHYVWDGVQHHVYSSTILTESHIYHIVATAQNNGAMRLFINGVEEGAADHIGTMAAGDHWQAGVACDEGWGGFNGTIDEIAFYDTVLDAETVGAHYRAGKAIAGPSPTPSRLPTRTATATSVSEVTSTPSARPETTPIVINVYNNSSACNVVGVSGHSSPLHQVGVVMAIFWAAVRSRLKKRSVSDSAYRPALGQT